MKLILSQLMTDFYQCCSFHRNSSITSAVTPMVFQKALCYSLIFRDTSDTLDGEPDRHPALASQSPLAAA